jgi:hypothetical protein
MSKLRENVFLIWIVSEPTKIGLIFRKIKCFKNWSFQIMSISKNVLWKWYSFKIFLRKIRIIENRIWKSESCGPDELVWSSSDQKTIFPEFTHLYIQAFFNFRSFDLSNFRFTTVYNSILFSSPLVTSIYAVFAFLVFYVYPH